MINRFWSDPGGGGPVDASSSGDTTKGSNKPRVEVAPKTSSGPKKAGPKKEPAHNFEIISFINKLSILLAKYEKNEGKEDNQANCQPVGKKTSLQRNTEFTKRKSRAEIKKEKETISAPRENIKKVWKLKFARFLTLSL